MGPMPSQGSWEEGDRRIREEMRGQKCLPVRRSVPTTAGFEAEGRRPGAEEDEQPREAEKARKRVLSWSLQEESVLPTA